MTKFDEETRQKLITAIRKGATYQIACDYAGIAYKNFRAWILRGQRETDTDYSKFRKDIKAAEGHTALVWLDVIDKAMKKEWTPAAWKLERRYYSSYSANPAVREEIKLLEERLSKIEKNQRQGVTNGKSKELDTESNS